MFGISILTFPKMADRSGPSISSADIHGEFRRYWRRRRATFLLKPVIWMATTVAMAWAGSASLPDDVVTWRLLWPKRSKASGVACDVVPGLSSMHSGRSRSGEGQFIERVLGIGLTENGSLTLVDDAYLWSPSPRSKAAGSVEFLIKHDEVIQVIHRRLRWGSTLFWVEKNDGSFVTLRGRSPKVGEMFDVSPAVSNIRTQETESRR